MGHTQSELVYHLWWEREGGATCVTTPKPHPYIDIIIEIGSYYFQGRVHLKPCVGIQECKIGCINLAVNPLNPSIHCSSIGSVIGIVLNPSSGFNNLVVVNSVQEFFYSVAWMGAFAQITGTVAGQITGFFADR